MWCSRALVPTYIECAQTSNSNGRANEWMSEWITVQMKKRCSERARAWLIREKQHDENERKKMSEGMQWKSAWDHQLLALIHLLMYSFMSPFLWVGFHARSHSSKCVHMKVCVPLNGIYSVRLIATLQAVHSHFVQAQFHSVILSVRQSLIHSLIQNPYDELKVLGTVVLQFICFYCCLVFVHL